MSIRKWIPGKGPLAVALLVLALAAGCASQSAMEQTQSNVATLEQEIAALKQQAEANAQTAEQFKSDSQSSAGAVASRVQGLEGSLSDVKTQTSRNAGDIDGLAARVGHAEDKATQGEGRLADLTRSLEAMENTYGSAISKLEKEAHSTAASLQDMEKEYSESIAGLQAGLAASVAAQSNEDLRRVPSLLIVALLADSDTTKASILEQVEAVVQGSGDQALIGYWEDSGFDPYYGPEDPYAFDDFLLQIANVLTNQPISGGAKVPAMPDNVVWTRQFGSDMSDYAADVSEDASGNIYVVGQTWGTLPGQTTSGTGWEAFLRTFDAKGDELWTRQFGSDRDDHARGVSVDLSGNVYVAGFTSGALAGQTSSGNTDAFLRKYDAQGNELWTRQFGPGKHTSADGVSADPTGTVYVVGNTGGLLPGQTSSGRWGDAFVRKYDAQGNELWTRQFGSADRTYARGITVDASGNVYVAGVVEGALPGQTSLGPGQDAFLRKYDAQGNELWTRQFGSPSLDEVGDISADAFGNVYVAGFTFGALPGQESSGDEDAFLRKYDAQGSERWTRQFGSGGSTSAHGVAADVSGNVYVAGLTFGALPGQTSSGYADAFLRRYDAQGKEGKTHQFGSRAWDSAGGVSVDAFGNIHVVGHTEGALAGESKLGDEDAFLIRFRPENAN